MFKFVMLPPNLLDHWPAAVAAAVPEAQVMAFRSADEAAEAIGDADAAYGTVPRELLAKAKRLRWICAPRAGLGGDWFYPELVAHPVVVTNTRGIFNDHLSHHVLGVIVAHSRHFTYYRDLQSRRQWGPGREIQHLPDCTLLVIGCGEAGAATAALAKQFGMRVLAIDPRLTKPPQDVDELHPPAALMTLLPQADYVVLLVPETPETLRMLAAPQLAAMKRGAYLINVGRGGTLVLDDLAAALDSGQLAGASLDVFETEPLPAEHRLWGLPQVQITPHVAGEGPHCWDRRLELIIENCRRFAAGRELLNVVDKAQWY